MKIVWELYGALSGIIILAAFVGSRLVHHRALPARPAFTLDLEDPIIRAALREVDAIAPEMPIAPPKDDRDLTPEERKAREVEAADVVVKERRRVEAKLAEDIRTGRLRIAQELERRWVGTNALFDIGRQAYLLPNGKYVPREEVQRLGWANTILEELDPYELETHRRLLELEGFS